MYCKQTIDTMDTEKLKQSAAEAKKVVQDFASSPQVQDAIAKGKDAIAKGKDWLENGQGKEYLEKGKQAANDAVDKLEDFVQDKTDGKGICGFGAKK